MRRRVLALIMAAVMVVPFAACGQEPSTEKTSSGDVFKIGAYLPLSGPTAAYGIEGKNALDMAIKEINENGGFNGVPAELVAYDTQCSVEEAVKVASKLLQEDKVDAMIGSLVSSEVFATGNVVNNAGVYMLGTGTSPNWMEEDWPYVFRAAMNNGASAPGTADMLKELDYKTVSIFYGQDDNALSTKDAFSAACEERGIEVVASESYDQGDTDFSAQAANLINADADCVYLSVLGETAPVIVKQLRQYGYNGMIFNKESFMTAQIPVAGEENSNHIAFVMPYVTYDSIEDIDIPEIKTFAEKYDAAYGEINKTDSAYRCWDAIMVMWEASKIAKSNDSDALKDATNQISGMKGLGGTIDFTDGNREGYNNYNSFILVDGKNVLWSDWIKNGGYEDFKNAAGQEK